VKKQMAIKNMSKYVKNDKYLILTRSDLSIDASAFPKNTHATIITGRAKSALFCDIVIKLR